MMESPALIETTVNGAKTQRWSLESEQCAPFHALRLARIGIERAAHPYKRVRLRPAGSFVMICLEGEGRVLLDGRWQSLGSGHACMAPPRVVNAFYAIKGRPWHFLWARYDEPPFVTPLVSAASPVRVKVDASHLAHIWEGLRAEWGSAQDAQALHHWTSLLHLHLRRLAKPWQKDERLRRLWAEVEARLAEDWSVATLAHAAHVSQEHFRRLCWKELGRSPMAHLTSLRVRAAQQLLTSTEDKQEYIAHQVGYQSPIAFARAFQRWVGCLPSDYRARE